MWYLIVSIPDLCNLTYFDPDQTRMEFRKECFVNLKICAYDRKYAKCRTKADAHDKMDENIVQSNARIQRGDMGSGPLSNTRSNPLKFSEQPSQHSTLSHHRHASETPLKAFRWRAEDGPLLQIRIEFKHLGMR